MRRCILHIGVPKTGSTALQRALRSNASALERVGILYRTTADGANQTVKHQQLAVELLGERKKRLEGLDATEFAALLEDTSAETVVLSSEAFSDPRVLPGKVSDFLDLIRRHDFIPTALVYVRPQPSLANSHYTQKVKTFRFGGSFGDFVDGQLSGPSWRYTQRLAPWLEQRGLDLAVVPFTSENTGVDIAPKMLKLAGVPGDQVDAAAMTPIGIVNETPGPAAVAAFRLLMKGPRRLRKLWRSTSLSVVAIKDAKRRGWYEDRFVGLDAEAANRIEEAYEQANESFAGQFLARPWREVFAKDYERTWVRNEIDLERLDPQTAEMFKEYVAAHSGQEG